jgi:lysozyme
MNIDAAGLHEIASYEGFVPTWYRDTGGVKTIGYGHTGELPAGYTVPLTVDAGLSLFKLDLAGYVQAVNDAVRVRLGIIPGRAQARFNALVSLCYNIGAGAFASSSLVREINAKGAPRDWSALGPLWLEFDHVNGAVVQGLLNRRVAEFRQFVAGRAA